MQEYERQVTIGSEIATLAVAGVLLATALLPETSPQHRAGVVGVAVALVAFSGVWFHALPQGAFGRWRFAAGTSVVQIATAALLALTGGVGSVYFPYFLLPVLATAFVPPRATVATAGVAVVTFAALTLAALSPAAARSLALPGTGLVVTNFFTVIAVSLMAALIGRAGARTRGALRVRSAALAAQNRELDVVRRAALSLARAADQEGLVRAAFDAAREGMRAEMVLLLVGVGGAFGEGLAATAAGVERFDTDPSLARSPGRVAVRERRSVVVRDAVAEGTELSPAIRDRLRLRSGVFVPLFARDQAFGLVIFASTMPTEWTPEEVRLAEALAEASSAPVASYAALAGLRHEADELAERGRVFEGIDRLVDALAVARDEADAAAAAARSLLDIFRLRGATTLLVDPSRAILEPQATAGEVREHVVVPDPGSCPAIRLGRAFDVAGPLSALVCPYMPAEPRGYFCLPLVAAGEPVGALFLEPGEGAGVDERAGRAAADRVALTVGNARVLETARRQATTDGLTGLYNRRFFEEQMRVAHSLAERHGEGYSVIAIDLDRLKSLNDTMGHEAGDEALRAFAATMRTTLRGSDIAARLGGDEFVVLASRTATSDAVHTAERILADLRTRARAAPYLSGSAGVASWRAGRSAQEVLQAADAMLYRAKSAGRDRVVAEDQPLPA